ncbi:MAG: DUF2911 domain-containing protein [Bacteroidota bacterium]
MKKAITNPFLLFILSLLFSFTANAQKVIESPRDSVTGKIGQATITVNYGSPSVKGRKIWGDLVPYGKVWRAGANQATTFTTDKAIMVEGKALPAGKYSFFAIPTEKEWTIVFNKVANQWGAYDYKEKDDALRVTVKPAKISPSAERLKYTVLGNEVSWRKRFY